MMWLFGSKNKVKGSMLGGPRTICLHVGNQLFMKVCNMSELHRASKMGVSWVRK